MIRIPIRESVAYHHRSLSARLTLASLTEKHHIRSAYTVGGRLLLEPIYMDLSLAASPVDALNRADQSNLGSSSVLMEDRDMVKLGDAPPNLPTVDSSC